MTGTYRRRLLHPGAVDGGSIRIFADALLEEITDCLFGIIVM
ncbi:hypothetical protein [Bosea sp. PAMC 26642]|nr:hypothetical protein [Bosea sp. PAMC 26642]